MMKKLLAVNLHNGINTAQRCILIHFWHWDLEAERNRIRSERECSFRKVKYEMIKDVNKFGNKWKLVS